MNDKVLNKVIDLATNGALEELLNKKGEVSIEHSLKANDVDVTNIVFRPEGENIGPSVRLDQFSENDPFEIIDCIAQALNEAIDNTPSVGNIEELTDAEFIKKNARIRIINKASSEEFLSGIPHKTIWGDLAAYVAVDVKCGGSGEGSYALNSIILSRSGMSFDEIYGVALSNNSEDISVRSMDELFGMFYGDELNFIKVVSNASGCYGASAILGHEEEFEGFYVIPSSVHELILMPKDSVPAEQAIGLGNMIRDVNCTLLRDVDILSDHAYHIVDGRVESVA